VLEGRVRDRWTDQYNRRLVARRRLVKEVWANLLLGRIHRAFPEIRIVLLLRHPFAVADSQLRTAWGWRADPVSFLGQSDLMEDHLSQHAGLLSETVEPFDRHVLVWCVENAVPLRQFAQGDIHVAFYERLQDDPETELPPLFAVLGRPWDARVLERVHRPSAVARVDRWGQAERPSLDDWRARLTADQVARGMNLLHRFGLDRIYGRGPMPLVSSGKEAFLDPPAS
jgi:hypothetical protein